MSTENHKPLAWMHEDGRVVRAETMEHARQGGGAMLSSLAGYTIPLYGPDALAAERERWSTTARLCIEATPEQLPMALDALRDALNGAPSSAGPNTTNEPPAVGSITELG